MAVMRRTTAAGGVVWRKRPVPGRDEPGVEVLLIHRPSYDDWTFPKGKADPGELPQATAVREIAEETGLRVRLGAPLPTVEYRVAAGPKVVSYWCARQIGAEDAAFTPNREVDEIRWVRLKEAARMLSYEHDADLLDAFRDLRETQSHRTRTLIVLRHGKAVGRGRWKDDDLERPLAATGKTQAGNLVPLLEAYGVRRVVSSPALRCAQTVEPYAHSISTFLQIDDRLGEETRTAHVHRSVAALLERKKPAVLCTHRPTLPAVFDAIGTDPIDLAPGHGVVIHHRKGKVIATELIP